MAAVSILLVLAALGTFGRVYSNPSAAMEPALPANTHLIAIPSKQLHRGDLAVFRVPLSPDVTVVKRVVALGGDIVEIRSKRLSVNARPLDEPYVVHDDPQVLPDNPTLPEPYRSRDHFGPYRVPPGHFFVLGDNRDRSTDSRNWGAIPNANLYGHVKLVFSWAQGFRRPT